MSEETKTLSTRDYSKFKSLLGNRFVKQSHVRKLIASLEHNNLLHANPILVTDKMVVIDGQHRLLAAKELGLEIYYRIVPGANLETVQELNSTMRAWTLKDFCESYAMLGKPDYETLLAFANRYGLPLSFSANLLEGKLTNQSGHEPSRVRNGKFMVKSLRNAEETVSRMRDIMPYSDAQSWRDPKFVRALVSLYGRGMKHEELLAQFRKSGARLQRQVHYRDYVFRLLDVYNKGKKTGRVELEMDL